MRQRKNYDKAALLDELAAGIPLSDIASRHGLSTSRVSAIATQNGLRRKRATPRSRNFIVRESGCWEWQGHVCPQGYGRLSGHTASRVFYQDLVGPIPDGLEIDHLCRNTLCVNPDHLEPVTHAENIRRRSAALTRCKHGHEFTPENTYVYRGGRSCRTCNRAAQARAQSRRAAQ